MRKNTQRKGGGIILLNKKVKLFNEKSEKVEHILGFDYVNYETAKNIMIKKHYSKKWNTSFGKINIGIFKDGELKGVAVFGNLMNPKSYNFYSESLDSNNVVELNRLWISDDLGKNTETVLLSACWKILKNYHPQIKIIQSFADGRLGVGTIYKASNFLYFGKSESLFLENQKTSVVYHKVPMENTARPDGLIKINGMIARGEIKAFKVFTYRYAYLLDKNIKLKPNTKPYPKYEIGKRYIDFEPPKNTMLRALILSYILNYDEFNELRVFANNNFDKQDIKEQIYNVTIEKIAKERNKLKKYNEILSNPLSIFNTNKTNEKQLSLL